MYVAADPKKHPFHTIISVSKAPDPTFRQGTIGGKVP